MRKFLIKLLGGVPLDDFQAMSNPTMPSSYTHIAPTSQIQVPKQRLALIVDMDEKDEFLPENQENHEQTSTN